MNQQVFAEQAVYQKHRNMKSSGYLDDQYELTREFKQLQDYHFRIEDDKQIIQLRNLQKNSLPMSIGFSVPNSASLQFNNRMNQLLSCLDSAIPMNSQQNYIQPETHGFYKLSQDAYDQKKSLEAAYQHLQLNSLNKRMENLTISKDNIKFKSKPTLSHLMKQQKQQQIGQNLRQKQLTKKMKKLTINDSQL